MHFHHVCLVRIPFFVQFWVSFLFSLLKECGIVLYYVLSSTSLCMFVICSVRIEKKKKNNVTHQKKEKNIIMLIMHYNPCKKLLHHNVHVAVSIRLLLVYTQPTT